MNLNSEIIDTSSRNNSKIFINILQTCYLRDCGIKIHNSQKIAEYKTSSLPRTFRLFKLDITYLLSLPLMKVLNLNIFF